MTSNKIYTLIYYYIPQDQDDPDHPNAYTIPLSIKEITYTDILKTFPIRGKFNLKFKYQHHKENYWMDINSNQTPLPIVNKHIWIRAERITQTQQEQQIKQSASQQQQAQSPIKNLSDLIQF